MEDFFLVLLIVGFVVLFIQQRGLRKRIKQLEELQGRIPAPQRQAVPQPPAHVVPAPPPTVPVPMAASVAAPSATAPLTATPRPAHVSAPQPIAPQAAPATVPAAPASAFIPRPPATHAEPKPRVSLEARLGQNWLNKLGITALVIGLALGLGKLLVNIGPLGKDVIAFVLALSILGLGVFLERKPAYKLFARVLIGGGWALTFFLSFAIYHVALLQVLHSEGADLVLMAIVAAAMVAHSLRYHSQVVTTFAFLLAFVTVGISEVTLFSLVAGALLTAALAFVVYRERWYALGLAGLIGVYLNHFLWLHRVLPEGGMDALKHGHPFADFIPSAALLLSYWLIFRLIYVLRPPLRLSPHAQTYDLNQGLATAAALLNSAGLLGLLKYQSSHPEWAFYGLLVLGAAELVLSLIARGSLQPDAETRESNRVAFITLSTLASVLLLAAIPFKFHGASWVLFWLLEAEAFYLTGIRIPEVVFRRLGIGVNLVTSAYIMLAATIALSATTAPASPHRNMVILFTTALIFWCNAEFTTRRWPSITVHDFDRYALRLTSFTAPVIAALGCTFLLLHHPATAWLGVAWLVLSLVLAFIADKLQSRDLATQADLLAAAAIIRTLSFNAFLGTMQHFSLNLKDTTLRWESMAVTAALLYIAMRRKTAAWVLPTPAIAATYSWLAGGIIALLCWYQLEPVSVAVAWGVFGLILFELGVMFRKSFFRHQAYALLATAFVRIFFANMQVPGAGGEISPSLYTVVPLIAAFAYIYERVHSTFADNKFDRVAGAVFSWCGFIAAGTLCYFELRPGWIIFGWTALAIVLLALAATLKRTIFTAQSLVTLLAIAGRGVAYHLFSPAPLATTFDTSRVFTIGATCAALLLSLPIAFYLRNYYQQGTVADAEAHSTAPARRAASVFAIFRRPEQPFFFIPLALLTLLLYVQLHGGIITIGWVMLGLAAFLFALTVKERSYRLSGLCLLMLGVAKVLAWDVWHVSPTDRYLTLIIMGASLLLVSFLYSRYRETLLKLL